MLINREEAYHAGTLTRKVSGWSDQELKMMIRVQGVSLAFLEGKGPRWWLAASPLRRELESLKDMARARGFGDIVACW